MNCWHLLTNQHRVDLGKMTNRYHFCCAKINVDSCHNCHNVVTQLDLIKPWLLWKRLVHTFAKCQGGVGWEIFLLAPLFLQMLILPKQLHTNVSPRQTVSPIYFKFIEARLIYEYEYIQMFGYLAICLRAKNMVMWGIPEKGLKMELRGVDLKKWLRSLNFGRNSPNFWEKY